MTVAELLSRSLYWQKHSAQRFFYCNSDENLVLLRMNNFPDEPLYTVINGIEIIDFDDLPVNWVLEYQIS